MVHEEPVSFFNPFGYFIRLCLIALAAFLAVGISSALTVHRLGGVMGKPMNNVQTGWGTVMIFNLIFAFTTLICVLSLWLPARRAERIFAEFQNGNALAHWRYSPEVWRAHLDALPGLMRTTPVWATVLLGLLFGGIALGLLGLFGYLIVLAAKATAAAAGIGWAVFALAVPAVAIGILIALVLNALRVRQEKRIASPWAFISGNAAYCGGEMSYWGTSLQSLHSVRLLPGNPAILELITGPSQGMQNAAKIGGLLTLFAGRHISTAAASQQQRCLIPVPFGAEPEAQRVIEQLASVVG
jgi:hypothetical protein